MYESWYFVDSVQGCTGFMASQGFSTGSAEVGATLALAFEGGWGWVWVWGWGWTCG